MKPELSDFDEFFRYLNFKLSGPTEYNYFRTGKVDRIFHQKYCYWKALQRALKHFPKSSMYNSCADNIRRGVTTVEL